MKWNDFQCCENGEHDEHPKTLAEIFAEMDTEEETEKKRMSERLDAYDALVLKEALSRVSLLVAEKAVLLAEINFSKEYNVHKQAVHELYTLRKSIEDGN